MRPRANLPVLAFLALAACVTPATQVTAIPPTPTELPTALPTRPAPDVTRAIQALRLRAEQSYEGLRTPTTGPG